METTQNSWWCNEFSAAGQREIDYLSHDGRTAVEFLKSSPGSRGLFAATMQLAIFLARNSQVERGCLVLGHTRLSPDRLRKEWDNSKCVLKDSVSCRLTLITVEDGESWTDSDEPYIRRIAQAFEFIAQDQRDHHGHLVRIGSRPGQKFYEILKLLICRWLQKQGPIPIGRLAKDVGCSSPTVRKSLERVSLRKSLGFTSSRSVELNAFPHDAWNELLALSATMRKSFRFRDKSGDRPNPGGLLRRLEKTKPRHLALGGVSSARFWHPDFDLHGTPRLDLLYHAPGGEADLEFVNKLDPALTLDDDPSASPALVIHPIVRAASLFAESTGGRIPWADPVETVLDLCDMSLTAQANQLLTHLRPEVRLE